MKEIEEEKLDNIDLNDEDIKEISETDEKDIEGGKLKMMYIYRKEINAKAYRGRYDYIFDDGRTPLTIMNDGGLSKNKNIIVTYDKNINRMTIKQKDRSASFSVRADVIYLDRVGCRTVASFRIFF